MTEAPTHAPFDFSPRYYDFGEIGYGIALEVEDTLPDGLAEQWQIDGAALLAKLRAMTPGQQVAIVELLERRRACAD